MKKVISLAIVISMLFAISASAVTTIQYTYTDKDGIVYHVGTFDEGDIDAGVIVNGKKHSLKKGIYKGTGANAFEEAAGKQNKFAIGLYTGPDYAEGSYTVVPYATDAEGKDRKGQAITIVKNADRTYAKKKVIENPVVADVENGNNNDTDVAASSIKTLTIKCDGRGTEVSNQVVTALIKVDIRALKNDYIPNSDVKFTLTGNYTSNWAQGNGTTNNLDEITICIAKANGVSQDWSDENAPSFTKADGSANSYYNALVKYLSTVPADKITVSTADKTERKYTFNITGIVQEALAANEDFVNLAFWVDNTDAERIYEETKAQGAEYAIRNAYNFAFKTHENDVSPYTLTYEGLDEAAYEAGLKTLKINEEEVDIDYIDAENTYTKYLPYGTTEVPAVYAEGLNAFTKVEVTQAASLKDYATINVKAALGDEEETYKVKFVVSPLESESVSPNIRTNSLILDQAQGRNAKAEGTVNAAGNGMLSAFEIKNNKDYKPYTSFAKLDLRDFANADLSGEFTLDLRRLLINWDTSVVTEVDASIYDVSDIFNWETDKTNNSGQTLYDTVTSLKAIDTVRIPTALSAGAIVDLETPITFDISEFARKCVREGNLTPTISFGVKDTNTTATERRRISMTFYLDSGTTSTSAVLNYKKYDAEALEALSEIKISSIKAGNDEINLAMIGADNKYVKYLPFGTTEVPEISVVANESADVSVTQAATLSDVAKIKVTSFDKSKTVEYEISFVVAENMSEATSIDVRDGFFMGTVTGSMNVAKDDAPNANLNTTTSTNKIQAFEAQSDSRYASCVSFVKLDLTKLTDPDLSKSITLDSYRAGISWDRDKMTQADMLIYDVTDLIDWETSKTDASGQTVEPLLGADRLIDSVRVNSDISNGRQGDVLETPVTFDITEFVAKCLSEGITQPVIAFDVEFTYSYTGMLRISNEHYYNNAGNMIINYSQVKDMPELRDTSIHALYIDFEPVDTAYINPANNTYTKYLPFGSEIPYVEAEADPWSQIWVTQAADFNEPAVIEVKAYNGDMKTYYVNFVISEKETAETTSAIGWNQGVVSNGGKRIISVAEQTGTNTIYSYIDSIGYVIPKTSGSGTTTKFIMQNAPALTMYNSPVAVTGYKPSISMMELDLTKLIGTKGLDLSKPIELHMDASVKTYNDGATDKDGKVIDSLDVALYDLTGENWNLVLDQAAKIMAEKANVQSYDYQNPDPSVYAKADEEAEVVRAYLRDINARLNGKTEILTQTIPYGNYGFTTTDGSNDNIYKCPKVLEANGFIKIDISEFVRYCVATGNMNPTIGFYVKPAANTNVACRQLATFNCSGTGQMSYLYYFK